MTKTDSYLAFKKNWDKAIKVWAPYIRLSEALWTHSDEEAQSEGLSQSFAMIRLSDNKVVINLEKIRAMSLENYGLEILCHEIGHHVYCPGDLRTANKLLYTICYFLPVKQYAMASMILNLFSDLLINERLQKWHHLKLDEVYEKIVQTNQANSPIWSIYLRSYEILWSLKKYKLAKNFDPQLEYQAQLIARIIRVYERDWQIGVARFTQVLLPFLVEEDNLKKVQQDIGVIFDHDINKEEIDTVPEGLSRLPADIDISPYLDSKLNRKATNNEQSSQNHNQAIEKNSINISSYKKNMQGLSSKLKENEIVSQYYKELAQSYTIPYPDFMAKKKKEALFLNYEDWEIGDDLSEINYISSVLKNPYLIPGYSILKNQYDFVETKEKDRSPADLYIGIDCSGSMPDPSFTLSYQVLSGVVLALSALKAGARVMVCLSGEINNFTNDKKSLITKDFTSSEKEILNCLCSYLGTGQHFALDNFQFLLDSNLDHNYHVLLITDSDQKSAMSKAVSKYKDGAELMGELAKRASSCHLILGKNSITMNDAIMDSAKNLGWDAYQVIDNKDMLPLVHQISQNLYNQTKDN